MPAPDQCGAARPDLAVAKRGDISRPVTVVEQMGAESFLYVTVSETLTVTVRITGVCGLALEDAAELAFSGSLDMRPAAIRAAL
jgi:hypothetical protein